mmetsp:Transcript_3672/g.9126  ORF Transcript_3672/g.9126 Transcript_3672/m.9126 type:complete len:86 (+) Transcript_3672:697-954(+)
MTMLPPASRRLLVCRVIVLGLHHQLCQVAVIRSSLPRRPAMRYQHQQPLVTCRVLPQTHHSVMAVETPVMMQAGEPDRRADRVGR